MTLLAAVFLLVNCIALLAAPRRWAPLPLLVGACYMTLGEGVVLGPFHFPIIRLLMLMGFFRALARGERIQGGLVKLDWIMIAWAVWALIAGLVLQPFISQLGMVYNTLGIYFLIRVFCRDLSDLEQLGVIMAITLAPVAMEMFLEQITGRNLFAVFGVVPDAVVVREGHLRAQGPFGHAILAGTVGAACLPVMLGIWRTHPTVAKIGLAACLLMVLASASSGPLLSVLFGVFALVLWKWRQFTRHLRWAAVIGYILLDLVMKAPAYFVIARIDITNGSNGWHRAELIKQAIAHFRDWWLAGTLYTRDWMPYGVSWSPNHCDITNQYIGYCVSGGLLLMLLFIAALWTAFKNIGNYLRHPLADHSRDWLVWSMGAALFAQAASCVSVAYFDQSFLFLYVNIAVTASLANAVSAVVPPASNPTDMVPTADDSASGPLEPLGERALSGPRY